MSKWVRFVMSIFFENAGALSFDNMLVQHGKKLVLLTLAGFILSQIAVASFFLVMIEGFRVFEEYGQMRSTPLLVAGASVLILAVFGLSMAVKKFTLSRTDDAESKQMNRPIEDAIALLIQDFVKEREHDRQLQHKDGHSLQSLQKDGAASTGHRHNQQH